jgi:hypothetical protein
LASTLRGGSGRAVSTRRSLLTMGATGLLAGGAAVAIGDVAGQAQPAAAASATTPDWVNVVSSGADSTGKTDSSGAFGSAISTVQNAGGGVVYIPAGTYQIASTVQCAPPSGKAYAPVYFVGDGAWATVISFTGTGDCFRIYDNTTYGTRTKWSGGVIGITIDGTNAGTAAGSTPGPSAGLHLGDLLQYELDLTVQNFSQSGSIGVHLDNNYFWTEQLFGRIYVSGCASHVIFDWTSSTASTSSGSFERCDLDIYINQGHGANDGVIFQNGAYVTNASLKIRGNFGYSTSQVKSAALRLTGSGAQANGGYATNSGIQDSMLDIGVECATELDATVYTPQTIVFGSGSNSISGCYGALNFGAAGDTFSQSNNNGTTNITYFVGQTTGDTTLPGQTRWVTSNSGFPAGISGEVSFRFMPTGNEVMVTWALTVAAGITLRNGTPIFTVDKIFVYSANKVIPGNNVGADLTGYVYAPACVTSTGAFQYCGPSYEGSTASYWSGQGVYTLSKG